MTCTAALSIRGEHFPCQTMQQMADGCENHDGWAHSNRDAEAIWCGHKGGWCDSYGCMDPAVLARPQRLVAADQKT